MDEEINRLIERKRTDVKRLTDEQTGKLID
jgi:hypothetical protein